MYVVSNLNLVLQNHIPDKTVIAIDKFMAIIKSNVADKFILVLFQPAIRLVKLYYQNMYIREYSLN